MTELRHDMQLVVKKINLIKEQILTNPDPKTLAILIDQLVAYLVIFESNLPK